MGDPASPANLSSAAAWPVLVSKPCPSGRRLPVPLSRDLLPHVEGALAPISLVSSMCPPPGSMRGLCGANVWGLLRNLCGSRSQPGLKCHQSVSGRRHPRCRETCARRVCRAAAWAPASLCWLRLRTEPWGVWDVACLPAFLTCNQRIHFAAGPLSHGTKERNSRPQTVRADLWLGPGVRATRVLGHSDCSCHQVETQRWAQPLRRRRERALPVGSVEDTGSRPPGGGPGSRTLCEGRGGGLLQRRQVSGTDNRVRVDRAVSVSGGRGCLSITHFKIP